MQQCTERYSNVAVHRALQQCKHYHLGSPGSDRFVVTLQTRSKNAVKFVKYCERKREASTMDCMDRIVVTRADDVTIAQKREEAREWATWDSSEGDDSFHKEYTGCHEERVFVISGQATLSSDDGSEPLTICTGDAVSFLHGAKCTWDVLEPMRNHYAFFDEAGDQVRSDSIACDECGVDCWEESWFVEALQMVHVMIRQPVPTFVWQDICPKCYRAEGAAEEQQGGGYHGAVLQREGETVAEQLMPQTAEPESIDTSKVTAKLPKKEKPNAPCSCGSGKKYKKCCMNAHREQLEQLMEEEIRKCCKDVDVLSRQTKLSHVTRCCTLVHYAPG